MKAHTSICKAKKLLNKQIVVLHDKTDKIADTINHQIINNNTQNINNSNNTIINNIQISNYLKEFDTPAATNLRQNLYTELSINNIEDGQSGVADIIALDARQYFLSDIKNATYFFYKKDGKVCIDHRAELLMFMLHEPIMMKTDKIQHDMKLNNEKFTKKQKKGFDEMREMCSTNNSEFCNQLSSNATFVSKQVLNSDYNNKSKFPDLPPIIEEPKKIRIKERTNILYSRIPPSDITKKYEELKNIHDIELNLCDKDDSNSKNIIHTLSLEKIISRVIYDTLVCEDELLFFYDTDENIEEYTDRFYYWKSSTNKTLGVIELKLRYNDLIKRLRKLEYNEIEIEKIGYEINKTKILELFKEVLLQAEELLQ